MKICILRNIFLGSFLRLFLFLSQCYTCDFFTDIISVVRIVDFLCSFRFLFRAIVRFEILTRLKDLQLSVLGVSKEIFLY